MSDRSEIRGTKKQWLAGKIFAVVMRLWSMTLRCRVIDPHGNKGKATPDNPMIWIVWHNTLFLAPLIKKKCCGPAPASALASASRDGAVIESVLSSFDINTVRGSSSRRGVAALIALKKAIKAGQQLLITPDGPRGPRYQLQPGVIKLAQSSGVPIIPVRFEYSSCWRLKSWDRFRIPKPFSAVTIHVGEGLQIPARLDEETFESSRKKVEDALREGIDDIPEYESEYE